MLPYSNNIGFLLTGGVCIVMCNREVQGVLKEEDMPMIEFRVGRKIIKTEKNMIREERMFKW